jgi:class 3 adenylate cyclase
VSVTGIGPDLAGKAAGGRKLIAIVYADMVGYSRLIGQDDAGTLHRLRTLRRALIDPAIREHGGRVVQTGGDSLLVAFDSIDGAVRCAVKVQQQVPVYDGDQPPDRRIRFRIGINIGDVIPDGTDLHGDGVNIAARLEAACPVGGICVSRSVRDHVHGRLDLAFGSIGELTLKNITRPVEAFVLRLDPGATEQSSGDASGAVQNRATQATRAFAPGVGGWRCVTVRLCCGGDQLEVPARAHRRRQATRDSADRRGQPASEARRDAACHAAKCRVIQCAVALPRCIAVRQSRRGAGRRLSGRGRHR